MSNCAVIMKPPNKLNIKYFVYNKPKDLGVLVFPLVHDVASKREVAEKCIIFCPTYSDCTDVFYALVNELGNQNCLYIKENEPVCDIFTAANASKEKDKIISDFTQPDSSLRIIVATMVRDYSQLTFC